MDKTQVLPVELDPDNLPQIATITTLLGLDLLPVHCLHEIPHCLEFQKIDLLLLDASISAPDKLLSLVPTLVIKNIPVVFLENGQQNSFFSQLPGVLVYETVFKPVVDMELTAGIATALRRTLAQELEKTRAALAKSEQEYTERFEHSPVGIYETTPEGRYRRMNQNMARFLGFDSPAKAIAHYTDIATEVYVDPGRRQEFVTALQEQGFVNQFDFQIKNKKGENLWFLTTAKVKRSEAGEPYFYGFMQDITRQKHTEHRLARNGQCLDSLVKLLGRPIESVRSFLDSALDEAISLTGSAIGHLYHYKEDTQELILSSWSKSAMPQCQVANPPRRKPLRHSGLWGETIRQRKPLVVNSYSLKHPWAKGCPQGHVPLTRYLGIPIFRDSSIVGIVGVANKNTDYTHNDVLYVQLLIDGVWNAIERYQLEQNYEQLFMSMAAGFILLEIMADAAGNPVDYKIVQANPAAGYLFGTPAQSFLGRTVREVLPEPELLVWIDRLHELARAGEANQFTSFTGITDRYLTSTLYSPQPGHIAIIIHDVTELKKITNQLEKSMLRVQELAEQSQAANRAKSEFLANMSHEIRTPLNGIVGMLQVLETTHLSTDQTQYVELALRSANRLTRLLSDILDISRIEAGKLSIHTSEFVFTDFKEGIAELFAVTAREKNLSLTICMYPEQPIRVVADETRLRQILFNLVGNALKFTRHGHVCADISLLAGDWHKKPRLLICVSDTGPGIPDEKVHEIFDPFTQAEGSYVRTHQGAGLGLSIVRRLVTLMNGVLSFDSRPDEGTSICASIPVALSEAISLPSGVDSGLNTT